MNAVNGVINQLGSRALMSEDEFFGVTLRCRLYVYASEVYNGLSRPKRKPHENNLAKSDDRLHRHRYAFQDGTWVPKLREHRNDPVDESWSDCNEVRFVRRKCGRTKYFWLLKRNKD